MSEKEEDFKRIAVSFLLYTRDIALLILAFSLIVGALLLISGYEEQMVLIVISTLISLSVSLTSSSLLRVLSDGSTPEVDD